VVATVTNAQDDWKLFGRWNVDFGSIAVIAPGTPVEVRTRYLSNWASGFEVVSVHGDQVDIRRQSDSVILPVTIAVDDIRPCSPDHEHP